MDLYGWEGVALKILVGGPPSFGFNKKGSAWVRQKEAARKARRDYMAYGKNVTSCTPSVNKKTTTLFRDDAHQLLGTIRGCAIWPARVRQPCSMSFASTKVSLVCCNSSRFTQMFETSKKSFFQALSLKEALPELQLLFTPLILKQFASFCVC